MTEGPAARLWQLISATLPVGAYAYSDGMEAAVDNGWVGDEADAAHWILELGDHTLAALDVPLIKRLYNAWKENDLTGLRYWNAYLLSSREAMELRQADLHMGGALRRLLPELGITGDLELTDAAFAGEFAHACVRWDIPLADAAAGYAWTWFEARVAAAIKLVPLGQTAGQRILYAAAERIGDITARGLDVIDADIGASAPALAIGSCLHEQQYSRLFRS